MVGQAPTATREGDTRMGCGETMVPGPPGQAPSGLPRELRHGFVSVLSASVVTQLVTQTVRGPLPCVRKRALSCCFCGRGDRI